MAHDCLGPDRDRLLTARLTGIAQRHSRRGDTTEAETVTAVAELRKVAGDRPDLLAEVVGLALGTAESRGQGYMVRGQAVAELCIAAGADESMIPAWIEEGRRRAEAARHPPFSGGVRPPLGDYKGTAREATRGFGGTMAGRGSALQPGTSR